MNDDVRAALLAQRTAFIEKFGREPGPTDPVFFDPDEDLPTQISGAKRQEHLTAALREAGLDESRIKAFVGGDLVTKKPGAKGSSSGKKADQPAATGSAFTAEEDARWRYSHRFPGFKGELLLDLTLSLLDQKVTRKAKALYQHTPEWEYFDLKKQAPYVGWEGTSLTMLVEAVPQNYRADGRVTLGKPRWTDAQMLIGEGVLPDEIWEVIYDSIDKQCKIEDQQRRGKRKTRAKKKPALNGGR